jgi:penicillin-binding protein 2
MRLKLLHLAIIFLFVFLVVSLINIEIIQGIKYRELSEKNCIRLISQPGARGNILDRNGKIIAGSIISYDIVALPQESQQLDKALAALSGIVQLSPAELKARFNKNYLAPSVPVTLVEDISREKAITLEEMKPDLDGIIVQPTPLRHYPFARMAAHVLGYLGEIDRWRLTKLEDYGYKTKDLVGFGGVEEKYDYYLRQEDGGLSVEVDHRGRFIRVLGFKSPRSGKDIQLCLDCEIQKIAEDSLGEQKGSVIVMDPDTGEILAMASRPDFNPLSFVKKEAAQTNILLSSSEAPLFNRAISGAYPAGSIFKPIVAAGALETGKINSGTSFFCPGTLTVGRRQFKCWNTHNQQDLVQGIANSCDVYFYRTGLLLGAQAIYDYALKFGLARTAGIELPYEAAGFLPNPLWKKIYRFQKWYDGDTANLAIGQGEVLVSPLQIARMMAVFANGGRLVSPYIIKAIAGQDISQQPRKVADLHLKDKNLKVIRKGLREVVSDGAGTANILADLPVNVAGKTGTAQVDEIHAHGWFAGFFPYEKPKFVVCVFLERAGHGYAAAVVARQIIASMAQKGLL